MAVEKEEGDLRVMMDGYRFLILNCMTGYANDICGVFRHKQMAFSLTFSISLFAYIHKASHHRNTTSIPSNSCIPHHCHKSQ